MSTTNFDELVARLDSMLARIERDGAQSDAMYGVIRPLLTRLDAAGILHSTTIHGPVLMTRDYDQTDGVRDTRQVVQAALRVPGGLGVALWDSEMFAESQKRPDDIDADISYGFVPFAECSTAIRALLLPHAESLLLEIVVRVERALAIGHVSSLP